MNTMLDRFDLTSAFIIAAFIGAFSALMIMQIKTQEDLQRPDVPGWFSWMRRFSWFLVAMMLFWCVGYAHTRSWQPWPPVVLLVIALDFNWVIRIVSFHMRPHVGHHSIRRMRARFHL